MKQGATVLLSCFYKKTIARCEQVEDITRGFPSRCFFLPFMSTTPFSSSPHQDPDKSNADTLINLIATAQHLHKPPETVAKLLR